MSNLNYDNGVPGKDKMLAYVLQALNYILFGDFSAQAMSDVQN